MIKKIYAFTDWNKNKILIKSGKKSDYKAHFPNKQKPTVKFTIRAKDQSSLIRWWINVGELRVERPKGNTATWNLSRRQYSGRYIFSEASNVRRTSGFLPSRLDYIVVRGRGSRFTWDSASGWYDCCVFSKASRTWRVLAQGSDRTWSSQWCPHLVCRHSPCPVPPYIVL